MLRLCMLHQSMCNELWSVFFSHQVSMLGVIGALNLDRTNVVKVFERSEHLGNTCSALEMLDRNLYDLLTEQDWKPLSVNKVRTTTKQVWLIVRWSQISFVLQTYYSLIKKTLTLIRNPPLTHPFLGRGKGCTQDQVSPGREKSKSDQFGDWAKTESCPQWGSAVIWVQSLQSSGVKKNIKCDWLRKHKHIHFNTYFDMNVVHNSKGLEWRCLVV